MLTLDSQGPPDAEIWYNLYLAAVAVDALCVRDGKAGLAVGLGEKLIPKKKRIMLLRTDSPIEGFQGRLSVSIAESRSYGSNLTLPEVCD